MDKTPDRSNDGPWGGPNATEEDQGTTAAWERMKKESCTGGIEADIRRLEDQRERDEADAADAAYERLVMQDCTCEQTGPNEGCDEFAEPATNPTCPLHGMGSQCWCGNPDEMKDYVHPDCPLHGDDNTNGTTKEN